MSTVAVSTDRIVTSHRHVPLSHPTVTSAHAVPPEEGTMTITSTSSQLRWIRPEDARLSDLLEVLTEQTELADYPHASRVEQQVLVYDWATLRHTAADSVTRRDVQAELARALADGPGIIVLTGAFDPEPLERATAAFERMIVEQRLRPAQRRATTSPSPAPTTASGTRSRSSLSPTQQHSSTTTPTTPSPSRPRPGSARATR